MRRLLGGHLNIEEPGLQDLKEWLDTPDLFEKFGHKFKEEFGRIIVERRMSPAEFEFITSDSYATEEDLYFYLKSVWNELFDGEPLPRG